MKTNQTPEKAAQVVALPNTNPAAEQAHEVPAVIQASRTVGTRIEAHRQLGILIAKYDAAQQRTDGLRDFKAHDDGSGLKLVLMNSHHEQFEVTNQHMINRCIEMLIETGQQITDGYERELLTFQV